MVAKKWLYDGRLIAKNFNNNDSGEFVLPSPHLAPNLPDLLLLKFLLYIKLSSQPFLGRHLGFHIFFSQWPSWGTHTFFYSWAVLGLDSTSSS